ncbi:MAG TPA: class I SAM-dependent methyltransferase [Blastocatellia bacterium]|nr:class I SAM-dependent methyltransferase [Blastocatellia bacterium]
MNALPQSKPSPRGCAICGATAARELYTAPDRLRNSERRFTIARCEGCGVLRTLPELSDDELGFYYPSDYWGGTPSLDWIRESQAEKTSFLARCEPRGGRLLDVGCGAGFFLRALDPAAWDPFGVETGRAAADAAERVIGLGRIFNGTLLASDCEDAYFDVVTFWSALEHTNEPRANLAETRRILKPDGTLIVQVPNAASYQARWFGGDWFALDAPRHRYHFTPATLTRLLDETGFEVYRTSFHSKAHNAHALRQSLKARLYSPPAGTLSRAAFLACVPFIKPFDFLMSALERGATLTVAARAR